MKPNHRKPNPIRPKSRVRRSAGGGTEVVIRNLGAAADAANEPEEIERESPETETPVLRTSATDQPIDDLTMLGEAPGFVRIHRIFDDGQVGFMRKVPRDMIADDIGWVGRTWGGGNYWLEVFKKDPENGTVSWERKFKIFFDPTEFGPARGSFVKPPEDEGPSGIEELPPSDFMHLAATPPPASTPVAVHDPGMAIPGMPRNMFEYMIFIDRERRAAAKEAEDRMERLMDRVTKASPTTPPATIDQVLDIRDRLGGKDRVGEKVMNMALEAFLENKMGGGVAAGPSVAAGGESFLERAAGKIVDVFAPFLAKAATAALATGQLNAAAGPKKPPMRLPAKPATPAPAPTALVDQAVPAVPGTENPPEVAADVSPVVETEGQVATPPPADNNGHKEDVPPMVASIQSNAAYQMIVPILLRMAENRVAPALAAERIDAFVDVDPPTFAPIIDSLLERIDLVEYLAVFEPEIRNHAEWLEALRQELLTEEEPQVEPVAEGAVETPSASGGGESVP